MRRPGGEHQALLAGVALIAIALGLAGCSLGVGASAPIVGHNCGTVHKGAEVVGDPSGPENCLWQAWTRCQAATLVYNHFSVDTGETHTVTIQPAQNGCVLRDAAQGYSANGGGSDSLITTYTCAGLQRAPDGGLLVHACGGEGDLVIPPAEHPIAPALSEPAPSPT